MKSLNCVLLIDDDYSTNLLNKVIIGKHDPGITVRTARNGEEALNYFQKNQGNDREKYPDPNLILLDINMPGMNGWEFLSEYREARYHENNRVIIIMLTNSLNPEDAKIAGAISEISGFEKKPLTRESIKELIGKYFGDNSE